MAIVEDGRAMLPKEFVEMALGLPNVLFAVFFADLIRSNRDSFRKARTAHLINKL